MLMLMLMLLLLLLLLLCFCRVLPHGQGDHQGSHRKTTVGFGGHLCWSNGRLPVTLEPFVYRMHCTVGEGRGRRRDVRSGDYVMYALRDGLAAVSWLPMSRQDMISF